MKSAWSFFAYIAYIKKKIFYTRKTYDNIYNILSRYRREAHEESLVLSDSHGNVGNMIRAVKREEPDMILHLGDCVVDAVPLGESFLI